MSTNALVMSIAAMGLAASVSVAAAQTLSSPDQAQKALTVMNRVVDHTQRLIAAKNFNQLPRENEEFVEGSDALKHSIAGDPATFKTLVETLLEKADASSKSLATASSSADASRLSKLHDEFANSVSQVVAAFPNNVKPSPANVSEEKHEEKSSPTTGVGK